VKLHAKQSIARVSDMGLLRRGVYHRARRRRGNPLASSQWTEGKLPKPSAPDPAGLNPGMLGLWICRHGKSNPGFWGLRANQTPTGKQPKSLFFSPSGTKKFVLCLSGKSEARTFRPLRPTRGAIAASSRSGGADEVERKPSASNKRAGTNGC